MLQMGSALFASHPEGASSGWTAASDLEVNTLIPKASHSVANYPGASGRSRSDEANWTLFTHQLHMKIMSVEITNRMCFTGSRLRLPSCGICGIYGPATLTRDPRDITKSALAHPIRSLLSNTFRQQDSATVSRALNISGWISNTTGSLPLQSF